MGGDAPRTIGSYEVLRELGRGGMGVVYEVRCEEREGTQALKLIHPGLADSETLSRFAREAKLLAAVQHPSVVRLVDSGQLDEGVYLVTERIEGRGLGELIGDGPFEPRRAAELTCDLAAAVTAVHEAEILHRDLKPDNVIVRPDGSPVLLDFGLARELDAEKLTSTGTALGTPAFMAPEQVRGIPSSQLDATTDIYGLGAVLFALLNGQPPFCGKQAVGVFEQVLRGEPEWRSDSGLEIPSELQAVCRLAMSTKRDHRFPTADALRADLERFLAGEPVEAVEILRRRSTERLASLGVRDDEGSADGVTCAEGLTPPPVARGEPDLAVTATAAWKPLQSGDRLGRYEIVRKLGSGGMGHVFLARDPDLDREVAVKTLLAPQESDSRAARFQREARAVAKLRHPNVIAIHDVGVEGKLPYFVMDVVEGQSMDELLATAPPRDDLLRLVEQVARAVQYAHDNNVLHRDLKPENVIVEPSGRAVVMDFGLAGWLGDPDPDTPRITESGYMFGTPRYMAPEQAMGELERIGPATDVFALGVMLYQCLTGQWPFLGSNVVELAVQIARENPTPPGEVVQGLPPVLEQICLRCLEKEPQNRYPSAGALADDLSAFLAGRPPAALPVRPEAPPKRSKVPILIGGTCLALILLPLAVVFGGGYLFLRAVDADLQATVAADPVARQHLGEFTECEVEWGEEGDEYVLTIQGSKGAGVITAIVVYLEAEEIDLLERGTLVLDSGQVFPLAGE